MHSLTPHRASWAPGVDSHLGNLWELKNTHISNCALHTVQCKPRPSDPHQPSISAAHLDISLHRLMAFPDRAVVCLNLISFLLFFIISFLLFNQDFSKCDRGRGGEERGADTDVGLMLLSLVISLWRDEKTLYQTLLCLEQNPRWATHSNHHVDAVQMSTDLKQFSCVNQSEGLHHE